MPSISVSNSSSPPTSVASTRNMKILPHDFWNQPPDEGLDPPSNKRNKAALFIFKNTLFKSSNTLLHLAFWLGFAVLVNVVIIVFFFRDHGGSHSSSSSNEELFEHPVVKQSQKATVQYFEAPPVGVVGIPAPPIEHRQKEAPFVENIHQPQIIKAPFVENLQQPQKIESPNPSLIEQQKIESPADQQQPKIEVPVVEDHQQPAKNDAPPVEHRGKPQKNEAPFVENNPQPPKIKARFVENLHQPRKIGSLNPPIVEQRKIEAPADQQQPKIEVPVVEDHQQPKKNDAPAAVEHHLQQPKIVESSPVAIPVEGYQYCKSGKVFVYDLPPIFNKEFIDTCQELDPWTSRCNAVSNGGFGPKATGLESVVPRNLQPAWYWTDMYSAEVIYHTRMLNYTCRTENPEEATAFYLPFYVGLAVGKYLWANYTSKDRDFHGEMLLNWVKDQPSWKRFNGSDHFLIFGRLTWDFRRQTNNDHEWGSSFIYMPLMKNVFRVSVERNTFDPLEISVPYPTAFHPRSESDILLWQEHIRTRNRTSLFCFVGATRNKIKNDFRGILMNYCKNNESGTCRVVDCSLTPCYDGAPAILEAFLDSDFCLQPKGDGYTRRSFFDCMLAGSIPVYFWRKSYEEQYQWHLPLTGKSSSVFIDKDQVRNETSIVRKLLEAYSREEIQMMRETVIDMIPRFVYAMSTEGFGRNGSSKDAFEITVEGVLRKFQQQRRRHRR